MPLPPKLIYEDFCAAADKLYGQMEMPTAVKTHQMIGHGSLATHQHYLNRWKEARKSKLATLPEQLTQKIQEKSQAYAEDLWKSVLKTQQEIHQRIQREAKESVEKAQADIGAAQKAKEDADQELGTLQSQWKALSQDHRITTEQLTESKKQQLIKEEANRALEKQLTELKMGIAQQANHFKDQDEKNRALFKDQLESQEKKAQERYDLLQKEKSEEKEEKIAAHKMIEKLTEIQKSLEHALQKSQFEAVQARGEIHKLEMDLQENQNQQKKLQQENQGLSVQIQENAVSYARLEREAQLLQKQFQFANKKALRYGVCVLPPLC